MANTIVKKEEKKEILKSVSDKPQICGMKYYELQDGAEAIDPQTGTMDELPKVGSLGTI